jgi:hypothetical protein
LKDWFKIKMDIKPLFELQPEALYMWVSHQICSESAMSNAIKDLGPVAEAYACALQVVASAAKRCEGKIYESTTRSKSRNAIIAGYISGLTLVERAILGGFNAQSASLLRQEFEAIAALVEIEGGVRRDGKTPQINLVSSVPSRYYGYLSNIAHYSDTAYLESLLSDHKDFETVESFGSTIRWMLSPQYLPGLTVRLFAMHTLLLLSLAEHQACHNLECHSIESSADELSFFNKALDFLREAGAIEKIE